MSALLQVIIPSGPHPGTPWPLQPEDRRDQPGRLMTIEGRPRLPTSLRDTALRSDSRRRKVPYGSTAPPQVPPYMYLPAQGSVPARLAALGTREAVFTVSTTLRKVLVPRSTSASWAPSIVYAPATLR